MSVDAPCPLSDFPSIRACTSTCPRLSRPGVTDWTERFKTSTWRVPTRMLAQDQARARDPHLFRTDDLVREAVLQHTVLMDPGFVGERVAADHRLVGLRKDPDHV